MSHVQLSRQIFLNLEGGGGGDKGNKFTLPFQFLTKTWGGLRSKPAIIGSSE